MVEIFVMKKLSWFYSPQFELAFGEKEKLEFQKAGFIWLVSRTLNTKKGE